MTRLAAVMVAIAASLAVMSSLHLAGALTGTKPFDPTSAGIAEAVIGVALVLGVAARRESAALAATAFAAVGFVVGLSFTVRGGDAVDVAYHSIVLPILLLTFLVLFRHARSSTP